MPQVSQEEAPASNHLFTGIHDCLNPLEQLSVDAAAMKVRPVRALQRLGMTLHEEKESP